MRIRAEQWAERVRAWRDSGMTAEQYATGQGFSGKTLQWWGGELARRSRETTRSKSKVAMARVVRPGELIAEHVEETPIAIVVGEFRVAIGRGFDASVLREILRVLAEVR
jgi:hypothetical protein